MIETAFSSVLGGLGVMAVDPIAPRTQMGMSLGWHIILACLGVGLPALVVFLEWRGYRTGDANYRLLARRWARALGVLFAVGAVSGTILSFEMGLLWSGMMENFGAVIGLPFAIEGFAFFIEAIFLGIYLYGWDRLPPRVHLLTGIPIVVSGVLSAFFVVSANAWMNSPTGFTIVDGRLVGVDPWAAMFNPATWPEGIHMILAAIMVSSFVAASVYGVAILRGKRDRYHQLGLMVPLALGAITAPIQIVVGDWAARFVAENQPTKLAAMEGLFHSMRGAPLSLGGIYFDDSLHGALELPAGLSLLVSFDPNGYVRGLEAVPAADRPLVNVVHPAFDFMVAVGFGLLALGAWFAISWWRRRSLPQTRLFLIAVSISGVAATAAMEAGWIVTEVGRQPWIVYNVMRVSEAVNPAPGIDLGLPVLALVYVVLTVATVYVLLRLVRSSPVPTAPQELDSAAPPVV
ncbi:cytochrome ubiquinol oxidase subunit I [Leifsonia sp. SIMBA_070]|uniref:cytochrome ubiquinol oxidase subunit I n=1 Tax=Leifsonia sp. SIMBA_070 TaxID=3085810 RepID=UPI00397D6C0D